MFSGLVIGMPLLKKAAKMQDIYIVVLSSTFRIGGLLMLAFTTKTWMAYVCK